MAVAATWLLACGSSAQSTQLAAQPVDIAADEAAPLAAEVTRVAESTTAEATAAPATSATAPRSAATNLGHRSVEQLDVAELPVADYPPMLQPSDAPAALPAGNKNPLISGAESPVDRL